MGERLWNDDWREGKTLRSERREGGHSRVKQQKLKVGASAELHKSMAK